MRRDLRAAALTTALLVALTGCGHAASCEQEADRSSAASDTSTCVRDASAVTSYPAGYPRGYPLPEGTVVYDVQDRGADGIVATGVTATPFDQVLQQMNAAEKAGFRRTDGETEADDAEADWTGHGFTGRWAIKRSATCVDETEVQLLARRK